MAQRSRLFILTCSTLLLAALLCAAALLGCGTAEQKVETRTVIVGPPEEQGDANSGEPAISADGNFVAFTSEATNLLKTTTFSRNIFIKEVSSGATFLVSSGAAGEEGDGDSEQPSISSDGRYVAFASEATNLTAADNNDFCVNAGGINVNCKDVFLKDRESGEVTLVSADAAGNQGDGVSQQPAVSADGNFVAFTSEATNLVAGDDNGAADVLLKDTASGALQMISADTGGTPGDGESGRPAISADGRFVAFQSSAGNLVESDDNGKSDVFLKDTQTGAVSLVSSDPAGAPGNAASGAASLSISADGRFVIFESEADNLVEGDVNGKRDVFLKDTQTGAVILVSTDAAGAQGEDDSFSSVAVSADGAMAFFSSNANNLAPADTVNKSDIFRKDVTSGAIDMISTSSAGDPGDGATYSIAVTPDGAFVAFSSDAANLVNDDVNGKTDIFLKDLETGETVIVSTSSKPEEDGE